MCITDRLTAYFFFFQAEDGIRGLLVTGVQTCALPIYMLAHQIGAPNSPQWFNTGLHQAYGIEGPAQGLWRYDVHTKQSTLLPNAYQHPQASACFIQSVTDNLVNDGGIMDLWTREARLFKYGSGSGTNFSNLRARGEKLSGGGSSSGLMSCLKI